MLLLIQSGDHDHSSLELFGQDGGAVDNGKSCTIFEIKLHKKTK